MFGTALVTGLGTLLGLAAGAGLAQEASSTPRHRHHRDSHPYSHWH